MGHIAAIYVSGRRVGVRSSRLPLPALQLAGDGGKDLAWTPLRPAVVCDVGYDHMQGDRFRHAARFRRWRPDRDPESCACAQLEEPVRYDLASVLTGPA